MNQGFKQLLSLFLTLNNILCCTKLLLSFFKLYKIFCKKNNDSLVVYFDKPFNFYSIYQVLNFVLLYGVEYKTIA